jgi:hypothetical protein
MKGELQLNTNGESLLQPRHEMTFTGRLIADASLNVLSFDVICSSPDLGFDTFGPFRQSVKVPLGSSPLPFQPFKTHHELITLIFHDKFCSL